MEFSENLQPKFLIHSPDELVILLFQNQIVLIYEHSKLSDLKWEVFDLMAGKLFKVRKNE